MIEIAQYSASAGSGIGVITAGLRECITDQNCIDDGFDCATEGRPNRLPECDTGATYACFCDPCEFNDDCEAGYCCEDDPIGPGSGDQCVALGSVENNKWLCDP